MLLDDAKPVKGEKGIEKALTRVIQVVTEVVILLKLAADTDVDPQPGATETTEAAARPDDGKDKSSQRV